MSKFKGYSRCKEQVVKRKVVSVSLAFWNTTLARVCTVYIHYIGYVTAKFLHRIVPWSTNSVIIHSALYIIALQLAAGRV